MDLAAALDGMTTRILSGLSIDSDTAALTSLNFNIIFDTKYMFGI